MWLQIAIGIVVGFLILFWILNINSSQDYYPNDLGYDSENSGLWILIVLPLLGALIFSWLGFFLGLVLSIIIFIMTVFDFRKDEVKKTKIETKDLGMDDIKTAFKSNFFNWFILTFLGTFGLLLLLVSFSGEGLFLIIPAFIFLIPCVFIIKKIKKNNK